MDGWKERQREERMKDVEREIYREEVEDGCREGGKGVKDGEKERQSEEVKDG